MKKQKPKKKSKLKTPSPECRNCGRASEGMGQLCQSCSQMHDEILKMAVKGAGMIGIHRRYYTEAIHLYRLWLIECRRQRLIDRLEIVHGWLRENMYDETVREKLFDVSDLFGEVIHSPVIIMSRAEKKLEEMFALIESA